MQLSLSSPAASCRRQDSQHHVLITNHNLQFVWSLLLWYYSSSLHYHYHQTHGHVLHRHGHRDFFTIAITIAIAIATTIVATIPTADVTRTSFSTAICHSPRLSLSPLPKTTALWEPSTCDWVLSRYQQNSVVTKTSHVKQRESQLLEPLH